ncbi:hypothetical protein GLAREA_09151 [Glarea lozoyensis ATCC 20868]|uniref:Uncharacterized protein n=1 Tax=Glarea lozoyensis (strain ATCC 20868 / MF5171) TaxID=1116229 RepID=S3EFM5_GLAL2|nr:uncharacterized protein GLAREA_09151 [Glarea lozoyensis ATCC 20868]EPE36988.1 hypothetical protein GLAREA_09151 [Glarea lozoyensis ATCC 20868]
MARPHSDVSRADDHAFCDYFGGVECDASRACCAEFGEGICVWEYLVLVFCGSVGSSGSYYGVFSGDGSVYGC